MPDRYLIKLILISIDYMEFLVGYDTIESLNRFTEIQLIQNNRL